MEIYISGCQEKSSNKKYAVKISKYMKLESKEYRKMLSKNTNVVENLMCEKTMEQKYFIKMFQVVR